MNTLSRFSRWWRRQDEPLVPHDDQERRRHAQGQKFAIKKSGGDLFIHSEIDPGGMGVWLMSRQHADTWDTEDEAAAFMRRCNERYTDTKLEVVPC